MRLLCSIIFIISALSGCAKKKLDTGQSTTINKPDTPPKAVTKDSLHSLALGDSYTIGEAVPQIDSYPYQLVNSLNANDPLHVNPPTIIAVTGWTTDNLIDAIAQIG